MTKTKTLDKILSTNGLSWTFFSFSIAFLFYGDWSGFWNCFVVAAIFGAVARLESATKSIEGNLTVIKDLAESSAKKEGGK